MAPARPRLYAALPLPALAPISRPLEPVKPSVPPLCSMWPLAGCTSTKPPLPTLTVPPLNAKLLGVLEPAPT